MTCKASFEKTIVYPQFLEGRSENGEGILKLTDDLTLHLEQRSPFGDKLLIRKTGEDNNVVENFIQASGFSRKLFQDRGQMASAFVDDEDGLRVYGTIGDGLRVLPMLPMERNAEGHIAHQLVRERDSKDEAAIHAKEQRGDVDRIEPEVHLVIDTSLYYHFNGKEKDIIAYFGAVMNSVNLRFESIKTIQVEIKITGFTFNKKETDEKYITWNDRFRHYDIEYTLANFRKTYMKRHSKLYNTEVDILVLVTRKDMCELRHNTVTCRGITGWATVGGACTYLRGMIVEDSPWSFGVVRSMARDLGRSLGAVLDGNYPLVRFKKHPGALKCQQKDGYLMSDVQDSPNRFYFSNCSAEQIKSVAGLETHKCLHTNNSGKEVQKSNSLPGEIVSLDKQCRTTLAWTLMKFSFDKYGTIGDHLRIRPMLPMERNAEGHIAHLLLRERDSKDQAAMNAYDAMLRSEDAPLERDDKVTGQWCDIDRIEPEVHLVIDTSLYNYFNSKEPDIIAYYGAVMNSVNLRFESIKTIHVEIKITGFTFNKKDTDEKYISWNTRFLHYDIVTTLVDFRKTYYKYHSTFYNTKVDILALVTRRDMCELREPHTVTCHRLTGWSNTGGACMWYRAIIVEDSPWSLGVERSMARELGRSLGSVKDGDYPVYRIENHPGARKCRPEDGYIMSDDIMDTPNRFYFSNCSAQQIKYVAGLESHKCLHTNNSGKAMAKSNSLPGEIVSFDMHCRMTLGATSIRFSFDKDAGLKGCTVPCKSQPFDIDGNVTYVFRNVTALDGTPCEDNKKVCIFGECVPNPLKTKKEKPKKKKEKEGKKKKEKHSEKKKEKDSERK